jgi:hypothetical protein
MFKLIINVVDLIMDKKTFYLKILVVLVLSYALMSLATKEIFIANTPRIRPHLDKYLALRLSNFINNNRQFLAKIFNLYQTPEQQLKDVPLKDVPFKMVSKGVYAKSRGEVSYTLIKADEVEWVEYSFEVKGKTIKIRMPQGQEPLPKEVFE